MKLLSQIESPADLKSLSIDQLEQVAREIREEIVRVVSHSGGHLASSLGAVELTVALHHVFDAPDDKIVWDVGHQTYAHKLLTGRRDQFGTLRKMNGLSGFSRMSESPYDAFTTGHSSTSISAGLGLACAKRLQNRRDKVIAVIGDGSLTAGIAYEGLNQTGDIHKDLIVVLNDNDMSIAKNVGALSSFLSRTLSKKRLQDMRREFGQFLKSLPKFGDDIYQFAKRSEESFKTFVTPGMLFEAFNFEYFGPINGHRLDQLINILNNIKHLDEPVLLHIATRKGKGYPPAEANPVYFHGCGRFEIATGQCKDAPKQRPSYTQVFGDTLMTMAETDPRIVAVTAAMPEGTGLTKFAESYPDRFYDVGIAEQHGVTFAAGMAAEGMRPVVAIYSTFLQRAFDQIIHDVCIEALPVLFALDRGGLVGEDGPTHHGLFDLAYLRNLPNMVVMAPKDENELRRMMVTALSLPGPAAIRYPRGAGLGVSLDDPIVPIELGKAEQLTDGSDIVILAIGGTCAAALEAAHLLETEQIHATVVNARFVKPLDATLIGSLAGRIKRVVTVEENVRQGGFGSAVLELLSDLGHAGVRVSRIGLPDQFIEHGSQQQLRDKYGLNARSIADAAAALMQ